MYIYTLGLFACDFGGYLGLFACLSRTFCLFVFNIYAQLVELNAIMSYYRNWDFLPDCFNWEFMQKLHKSKTPKVYKNKKLNNANFGTYNLNDYQVFLHFISKIGGVDASGNYLQPTQLQREHTLTAKEFAEQFNLDLTGAYKVLQRAGKRMANTAVSLEKPELFEIWDIPVCTSKYNYKEGSLTIRFTEDIMPYLAQVKRKFVLYNLKEVANFGSIYSTRLYPTRRKTSPFRGRI